MPLNAGSNQASQGCSQSEAACLYAVDKLLLQSCFFKLRLLLDKLGVEAAKMARKLKLQVQRNVAFTALQAGKAAINAS